MVQMRVPFWQSFVLQFMLQIGHPPRVRNCWKCYPNRRPFEPCPRRQVMLVAAPGGVFLECGAGERSPRDRSLDLGRYSCVGTDDALDRLGATERDASPFADRSQDQLAFGNGSRAH